MSFFLALLTVTMLAPGEASLAQPASPPMKQFVIIFRQGPRQLTEAELKSRTEETRLWAQHQNAAGHKLDPHILAPEGQWIEPDGDTGPVAATSPGVITALLFLEAHDLTEAVDVAKAHPGLRYGASVEVRPWAPPPAPPPPG